MNSSLENPHARRRVDYNRIVVDPNPVDLLMTEKRRIAGVTLIELMIVVVIIGILASIAYPGYSNYMRQTRRSDAQTILLRVATLQEKYFTDCSTYAASLAGALPTTCASGQLGLGAVNPLSSDGYYQLTLTAGAINASVCGTINCGFAIAADPVAGKAQAGNGALRIDSTGRREWEKSSGNWVSWSAK